MNRRTSGENKEVLGLFGFLGFVLIEVIPYRFDLLLGIMTSHSSSVVVRRSLK